MAILDAVVPVAGRGTRLAPLTRAVPKELLPLGDRPVVEHVVDELAAAGLRRVLLVTSRGKEAIEDHLEGAAPAVAVHATRQHEPSGLGDAVLCAAPFVDGPFVLALGDAVLRPAVIVPVLLSVFESARDVAAVIAVERVAGDAVSLYGIVAVEEAGGEALRVTGLVEKPAPADAPSNLAVAARYVLTPAVLDVLRRTPPDATGEVQLTDALATVVADGGRVLAVPLPPGVRRLDIGSVESYRAACAEVDRSPEPAA